MEWNELETKNNVVKFSHQIKARGFVLSGILRSGMWAWLAEDNTLQIVSLKNGQLISSHTFCSNVYNCDAIICVSEISMNNLNDVILAVCLDYIPNSDETGEVKSSIVIYSVKSGCVLNCLRLAGYVNCMQFMPPKNCHRSFIQHFDGCLAVGTQEGIIVLIDLYLNYLINSFEEKQIKCLLTQTSTDCHVLDYNLPLAEIHRTYKKVLRERSLQRVVHFGIQLEVIESPCSVESLLPIDLISGLAVGLKDGRLVMYDITEMQIFYASKEHEPRPLIKLDFLEPPDDPRACFYILALHANKKKVVACMYAFMFGHRLTDEQGQIYFDNFLNGSLELEILLESCASIITSCQAVTKPPKTTVDDATSLFAISWNAMPEEGNKFLIFDVNQWYKEEMPSCLFGDKAKSCLATFKMSNQMIGLAAFLNPATISHFNSIQRCEEHFYPNSLSFDWLLLDAQSCRTCNWPGIQNKTLNILRGSTAAIFLEPDVIFERIREARLLPQFTELNAHALFSQSAKYEVLLAVALENNCMGLLRDCARSWADGSFTGNNGILFSTGVELSLQTLEKWIWKRASDINKRCNELCEGLLSSRGHPLDEREKKELGFLTKQLRNLADLLDETIKQSPKYWSENSKDGSLHLAADYQELLIWLINIGLLPEVSQRFWNDDMPTTSRLASKVLSIYPYKQLKDYYVQRRLAFAKIDESCISKKSGSCRLIFIDAFIEHECMRYIGTVGKKSINNLREHWLQNGGNGLYPPANIESMLRIMLLPNVSYDTKCSILFYFFLDLHVALTDRDRPDGQELKEIVENFLKFPSVFKLSPSLTKTLQAFWHLDHGNIVAAVDEFLSPFNNKRETEQWLIELFVGSLLLQNAAHLALRILDAHSSLISPSLKLNILLSNNLVAEAFHFVRSKDDVELAKHFFTNCLKMGKLNVIRDLALNEKEGTLVENLLKRIQLPGAKNLHFVYLLQKSKYIEAVSYMDELSQAKSPHYARNNESNSIDAPNLVMSAFNTTMTPVTQNLTDVYFRIRNKIKQKETNNRSPVPLSCQLIKQNANNLLGGIYHSSALSAHFATCYYDEELQYGRDKDQHEHETVISPLSANNAPFLRKPQTEICRDTITTLGRQTVSYPQEFKVSDKRRIAEMQQEESVDPSATEGIQHLKQSQQANKKRRLLGEELLTGLKHFQQKNIVLNDVGLNLTQTTSSNAVNSCFLTQPLETKQASQSNNRYHAQSIFVKQSDSNELHSILKLKTPDPAEARTRNNEAFGAEEKTLRFTLPSSENKLDGSTKEKTQRDEECQVKDRVVTTCISEDANSEDEPEEGQYMEPPFVSKEPASESVNITEYYSTLSSQDQTIIPAPKSIKDSGISQTSKHNLDHQESSTSHYQSARCKSLSPNITGPKPRKPLSRMSADPEKFPENNFSMEKKISPYEHSKTYAKESSSGLGVSLNKAFEDGDPKTVSFTQSSLFKISSVTTLPSVDFTPQICSSKVGETHTKLPQEQMKMSERSTIIMTSASDCDISEGIKPASIFIKPRPPLASVHEQVIGNIDKATAPSLDTTLGMSSCDVMDFEMTTVGTVEEETPCSDSQESETSVDKANQRRVLKKCEEIINDVDKSEESDSSSEVIELLSSSELSEDEMIMEVEALEESLTSENESDESSDDRETNTSNYSEEALSSGDSNDIVLQQEDSCSSDDTDSNICNYSKTQNESELEIHIPVSLEPSSVKIESTEPFTKLESEKNVVKLVEEPESTSTIDNSRSNISTSDILILDDREIPAKNTGKKAGDEGRKPEIIAESITSKSGEGDVLYVEKIEERLVEVLPKEIATNTQDNMVSVQQKYISAVTEKQNPKSDAGLIRDQGAKIVYVEKIQERLVEVLPKEISAKSTDKIVHVQEKDASAGIEKPNPKTYAGLINDQEEDKAYVEKIKEKLVEVLPKDIPANPTDKKVLAESEESVQENVKRDNLSLKQSPYKDPQPLFTAEKDETATKKEENDISTPPISSIPLQDSKELEKENSAKDIDMTDHFETPNTSLQSIKQNDSITTNVDSINEEGLTQTRIEQLKYIDVSDNKNVAASVNDNFLRSTQIRSRGQSLPPHLLVANDENIETDSQTPKRRSKRGISVPPQTIEAAFSTPNTSTKRDPTATLNYRKTHNVGGDSPQSPNSSRSGRDSQLKRSMLESGGTALLDSPAMRTRSRLRTISENSDTSVSALNSPAISAKRPRRLSVSSTLSEQQQQLLTPKRSRRSSVSGQSDTEGTPRTRRLITKEVDEESQNTEEASNAETGMDIYSSSRRLTRTQHALLLKSELTSLVSEGVKDDQTSMSSRLSQTSTQSKHRTSRGTSVKSNDDGDDDRVSVTSSIASETRRSSRRLRAQQQQSPNTNLSSIPEDDIIEGAEPRVKRSKSSKK